MRSALLKRCSQTGARQQRQISEIPQSSVCNNSFMVHSLRSCSYASKLELNHFREIEYRFSYLKLKP